MEPANQRLFQIVSQEMLKYKPSLQNVAASGSGEDDNDEQRFLGQMLIKNFPLPIGIELRRLFSISLGKPDNQRLEQLLVVIQNGLQLISYILVSQLWNEKKLNRIVIPESFRKIFRQKIYLRNIENFIWIVQSITNLLEERSVEFFVPELPKTLDEKFLDGFEFQIPGKNAEGHYIIKNNPAEVESLCFETEEKLIRLLERLAFLVNYKLVSVQQIKVIKPKYQKPKYNHVLKLLTCSDSDFNSFEMQDSICADSHSVLLMNSQLPLNENLNLSPLIIDTSSFLENSQVKNNIKKDIFIYDGQQNSHLNYKGCRVTEKCDFISMPDYPMLIAQFKDMMDTIAGSDV